MRKFFVLLLLGLMCAGIAGAAACKKKAEADPTGAGIDLSLAADGTVTFLQDKDLAEEGRVFYYSVLGEKQEFLYNKWERGSYPEEGKRYKLSFDLNSFADFESGELYVLSVSRRKASLGCLNLWNEPDMPYVQKLYGQDGAWELFFTLDEEGNFRAADEYFDGKVTDIVPLYPLSSAYCVGAELYPGNLFQIGLADGRTVEMPLPLSFTEQIDTSKSGERTVTFSLGGASFSFAYTVANSSVRKEGETLVYSSLSAPGGELVLAAEQEDEPIVGADRAALESVKSVEKLTVPFGLEAGALVGFDRLKELTVSAKGARLSELFGGSVPDSLETVYLWDDSDTVPAYFYHGGQGIRKIVIPANYSEFEQYAFSDLDGVRTAVLSGNVPARDLPALEDVRVADGSTSVRANFLSGTDVKRVFFPDSVQLLGDSALASCTAIESIRFSAATKSLGARALYATAFPVIRLPLNVRTIGEYAMSSNFEVTEIVTGSRVENIGKRVFHDCRRLKTLKIPSPSVRYQSEGMLQYTSVEELWIGGTQPIRWLYGKPGKDEDEYDYPYRLKKLRVYGNVCDEFALGTYRTFEVELDDSVKVLGEYSFASCGIFTSIDLNRVEEIKEYAFWENRRCTEIIAGDALKKIGLNAFFASGYIEKASETPLILGDGNLIRMNPSEDGTAIVPDGVKRIGYNAFGAGLVVCDIPASVEWIDGDAFFAKEDLRKIILRGRSQLGGKPFATSPKIEEICVNIADIDYYRDAKYWNSFAHLVKPL